MAAKIAALFPGCPTERAEEIARHAAAREEVRSDITRIIETVRAS